MSQPIYATDQPGEWRVILSGQKTSADGAHRWEAENLNGYSIFNNGEDLPATYRLGDKVAKPIYELREQGIAYVGTIGVHSGILMAANIGEIQASKLEELFTLKGGISASQAGAVDSGASLTTGQMASGSATVTASSAIFTDAMVGHWVWFDCGWHKKITALVGASPSTQVTLEAAPTFNIAAQSFFIVDDNTSYRVTAVSDVFTADMVGLGIMWPDGATRIITDYIDAQNVDVDMYVGHAAGILSIENADTYADYAQHQFVNQVGYKIIWSMPGEPRRWAAQGKGTITRGTCLLQLKYPMKSLETGQQIVIAGAGIEGGNHVTTIQRIYGLNNLIVTTTAANSTVVEGAVMRADAVGSIVGGYDLQDEGSEIVRIKPCRGELVVYKDAGIFLGKYSGLAGTPFAFKKISIPNGSSIYYPWSLIEVEGLYHLYASRDAFYRFDMTSQLPTRIPVLDFCDNIFFQEVQPSDKNSIWTADNLLTKEILLVFPTTKADKGIYYDYYQQTVSTTSAEFTAARTVKRPFSNFSDDWFIMGTAKGAILVYGKMTIDWPVWAWKREIFFRRDYTPYNKTLRSYDSLLYSGLADLGEAFNEKDWLSWVLIPASQEQDLDAIWCKVAFYGARNVSEMPQLLGDQIVLDPKTENLVSIWYSQHCLQDRIRVTGYSPFRLSSRIWEVAGVKTKSITRREE